MSSILNELRNTASGLVDSLTDTGINLREHLKDPLSFGKLVNEQSHKIEDLKLSVERTMVTLPDGTGREVFKWEYAALGQLARDNRREVIDFLGTKISIKNGCIVEGKFCSMSLENISAVSHMFSLQVLSLTFNHIKEISAVTLLTELKKLDLTRNQIQDISALSGLSHLQALYLGNNQIQDISAIAKVTGLQRLALYDNRIKDISTVAGLTNLRALVIGANPLNESQNRIIEALKKRGVDVRFF